MFFLQKNADVLFSSFQKPKQKRHRCRNPNKLDINTLTGEERVPVVNKRNGKKVNPGKENWSLWDVFSQKEIFYSSLFISSHFFQNTCDVCMYLCRYTNGVVGRGKNLLVSKSFSKCLSPDGWSYGASDEGSASVAGRKPRVCSGPRLDGHSQAVCKYRFCLSVQEGICTK